MRPDISSWLQKGLERCRGHLTITWGVRHGVSGKSLSNRLYVTLVSNAADGKNTSSRDMAEHAQHDQKLQCR